MSDELYACGYLIPHGGALALGDEVCSRSESTPSAHVPAQLWPVQSTNQARMYPRVTEGGAFALERTASYGSTASIADPTNQQSVQRTDGHLAGNQLPVYSAASALFMRDTSHDTHGPPFASAPVALPVYPLARDGLNTAPDAYDGDVAIAKHVAGHNTSGMPLAAAIQADTTSTPILFSVASANRTWEDVMPVSTGFMSQTSPSRLFPSQLHLRAHRIQPHLVHTTTNETSNAESLHPSGTHNEEDFYAFLCEWTDEHGQMCNMQIAGDRVSMSHHLSHHHDVTGDEKSQRLCLWRGCTEMMNKGSLARHVVSRHLRAGASCGFCSKVYSRADVARRHTKKCKAAQATAENKDDVRR